MSRRTLAKDLWSELISQPDDDSFDEQLLELLFLKMTPAQITNLAIKAVEASNYQMITFLAERGVNLNEIVYAEISVVVVPAIEKLDLKMIDLLLELRVSATDFLAQLIYQQASNLAYATFYQLSNKFLTHGAAVPNNYSWLLVDLGCSSYTDQQLIDYLELLAVHELNFAPLILLAKNRGVQLTEYLLKHGAKPDYKNHKIVYYTIFTALTQSKWPIEQYLEQLHLLFEYGANPDPSIMEMFEEKVDLEKFPWFGTLNPCQFNPKIVAQLKPIVYGYVVEHSHLLTKPAC